MDDVGSLGTEFYKKSPIKFEEVAKLSSHCRPKLVLIEGSPGMGKTTFSWEFCRKRGKGEILQDHPLPRVERERVRIDEFTRRYL